MFGGQQRLDVRRSVEAAINIARYPSPRFRIARACNVACGTMPASVPDKSPAAICRISPIPSDADMLGSSKTLDEIQANVAPHNRKSHNDTAVANHFRDAGSHGRRRNWCVKKHGFAHGDLL
jgi:hypothetical protein